MCLGEIGVRQGRGLHLETYGQLRRMPFLEFYGRWIFLFLPISLSFFFGDDTWLLLGSEELVTCS